MAAPLRPTPTSVAQLLDAVLATPWPTDAAQCNAVWRPLGIRLGEALELPPGHDEFLMRRISTPLEAIDESSLILTPDGRPSSLGFFLYRSDAADADQQTGAAFESMVEAITEKCGSDVVNERSPGACVWRLDTRIIELYLHPRTVHPRKKQPVGPGCLQIGLGPAEPTAVTT